MRKLLSIFLLLCASVAVAQIDIPITAIGPYRDLARNVTWANVGQGSINNNYVLTPAFSNEGFCVYLQNNDTSSHSVNVAYFGTGDQTVTQYTGNTSKWVPAGPSGTVVTAASSTSIQFVRVQGVAKFVVSISTGTAAGTVTATVAESLNGTACGGILASGQLCPITSSNTPITSTGTSVITLLNNIPGQRVYVCGVIINAAVAYTAPGTIKIQWGSSGTCTSPGNDVFDLVTGTTFPQVWSWGGAGALIVSPVNNAADFINQNLCVTNSTGQTLTINWVFNVT